MWRCLVVLVAVLSLAAVSCAQDDDPSGQASGITGCTNGDCPDAGVPTCHNGDCPDQGVPTCHNGDCPDQGVPGCHNGDCPDQGVPGCHNGDCPDQGVPGCHNGDCPDTGVPEEPAEHCCSVPDGTQEFTCCKSQSTICCTRGEDEWCFKAGTPKCRGPKWWPHEPKWPTGQGCGFWAQVLKCGQ